MKLYFTQFILIFACSSHFYSFAGVFTIKDSLSWEGIKSDRLIENKPSQFLYFKRANYSPEYDRLPCYEKQIKLNNSGLESKDVSLVNTTFQDLSIEEENLIRDNSFIKDQIIIEASTASSRGEIFGQIKFVPIKKNNSTGKYQKLVYFELHINAPETSFGKKEVFPAVTGYASNSVLSTGTWYKVGIVNSGIYKIDYTFLQNLGIELSTIDPRNLKIYGNGGAMLPYVNSVFRHDDLQENAIEVVGESDGIFNADDYVLFYGDGPHKWNYNSSDQKYHHQVNQYSDSAYYFITIGNAGSPFGKRITSQASSTQTITHSSNTFDDFAYHENDASNLIKSGREWYGEKMDVLNSLSFSFSFPNLTTTSPAYIKADIAARYQPYVPNTFNVSTNGGNSNLSPGATNFSCYWCDVAVPAATSFTFTPSVNPIPVLLTKTSSSITGWLNYLEVNVRRQLNASGSGNQFLFRDMNTVGTGNICEFTLNNSNSNWRIWDITDIINIKQQATILNATDLKFILPTDTLKTFIAFNGSSYFTPAKGATVAAQNLHGIQQADMVIVSHPLFLTEANTIADLHRDDDGLSVTIVTPQEIYNEFSSGKQDVTAIRSFVKMLFDRNGGSGNLIPKYLLLFGDASYDHKKRFASNTNYIPAFQSANSTALTSSYVSDDFFGLLENSEGNLDAGGLVDIGIGRFPVKSKTEAQTVVNKILKYTSTGVSLGAQNGTCNNSGASNFGDWRNAVCFIGDDEEHNLHMDQSNQLADGLKANHHELNIDKIFLDAYVQQATPGGNRYPEVSEAIDKKMERGSLIINYTGHGGEIGLAHERIVEIPQINNWSNINKLPLMFTATCEFSRFDDPERTSAGELAFLNSNGGAIAMMTTVRLVYAQPNFNLNQNFYDYAFDTLPNGEMPRIGDLFRLTKVASGPDLNNRNFTMFGDPALRLAYPKHDIVTTSVSEDTLRALTTVTVTGYVQDKNGNKLTSYNGFLYPTIYDKAVTLTTLSNDGTGESPPYNFSLQKNVIYKGKASVTNGDFIFSFIIPKDLAGSSYGFGRISYYAENGYEDANGYKDSVIIGGAATNTTVDNTGPEVHVFLNDEKFVFGGITNESPQIYAKLKDDNGINTSGIGIGHDITAVIDANTSQQIVLNDYYESDLNNYKSGSLRYPLKDLSEGRHTLKVKGWDVYNNSSESYTEFVVAPNAQLALEHVLNYPNPFTTNTAFYFEHNRPCDNINVQVQIFTVSGKLVKTISKNVVCEGYRSNPLTWDGKDEFGEKIARGVYLYRLKIRSSDNNTAEQIEKLVVLN